MWDQITPQGSIAAREAARPPSLEAAARRTRGRGGEGRSTCWGARPTPLEFAGRVLSAANAELPVSGEPLTRLWQATTLLREHRGDGHFAALAAADIDGCEAVVLRCAKDIPRDLMQPTRGWTDEQWGAAATRLAERGWIGGDGALTPAGRAVHDAVEAATDRAAARPWDRIGPAAVAEAADVLFPLAQACAAALPEVIPVGRLQPTRP